MAKVWEQDSVVATARLRWNLVPTLIGNEWHSPCPFCPGGNDRFIIRTNGRYWCRKCHVSGWLDEHLPDAKNEETAEERIEREAREAEERRNSLERWRLSLEAKSYLRYHESMEAVHVEWWRARGLSDNEIKKYQLGFCPQKTFKGEDGKLFSSSAYTIPVFRSGEIVNLTYRIVNLPNAKAGKYRQVFEIPQAHFYTEERGRKKAVLVEGAIKAMVVYRAIGGALPVIGSPGISPHPSIIAELETFEALYFIPDPDVTEFQIGRWRKVLGRRLLVREMPVKPDDAFVIYGLDIETFKADYLRIQGDWE